MVAAEDKGSGAFVFRDGRVLLSLDLRVYRLAAVQKAAYKFAKSFGALLGPVEGDSLSANFEFPPSTTSSQATSLMLSFFEELLDQELRERIADETHAIRSLILAQAFSRTDLIRRDGP